MSQELPHHFVVPDSIEPVVGWKAWRNHSHAYLWSPTFPQRWPTKEALNAICGRADITLNQHPAPDETCTCGIYISRYPWGAGGYGPIIGQVYGWGKVIEHELGWRVEYAYPKEIYVGPDGYDFRWYEVPVRVLDWDEMHDLLSPKLGESGELEDYMRMLYGMLR